MNEPFPGAKALAASINYTLLLSYSKGARHNMLMCIEAAKKLELTDIRDRIEFSLVALERAILRIEKEYASQLVDSDSNSSDSVDSIVGDNGSTSNPV